MMDEYVIVAGKRLRCGYTTGSCAQAATKAAATGLLTGCIPEFIEIDTPLGVRLKLEVVAREVAQDYAIAGIRKDAGDDPDVTDGIIIYSKVSHSSGGVSVDGGEGIGRIERKGLFSDVGEAAINPVPKRMILKELSDLGGNMTALIYCLEGELISKRTFNSQIGIVGGISIIGTTGIVRPMSDDAILKTIYMELDMHCIMGTEAGIVLTPGNHGEKFAASLGLEEGCVKVSNFIGDSLLYAYSIGFRRFTLIGHIGKFAKLSIGIYNTHSKVADSRMESFIYYMALLEAPQKLINKVSEALTAEECAALLISEGCQDVFEAMKLGITQRVKRYLKDDEIDVQVYMYSMEGGLL